MADIKVDWEALKNTASSVDSMNESLSEDLENISTAVAQLSSTWKSDASDEIRANMQNLKNKYFGEYKDVISSYTKFLRDSAEQYTATETSAKSNATEFK